MSKSEDMLLEVIEFVQDIWDGSICDEDFAKLQKHLDSSAEARALYNELLSVHVGLEVKYKRRQWEQKLGIQATSELENGPDIQKLDPLIAGQDPMLVDSDPAQDQLSLQDSETFQTRWENSSPNSGVIRTIARALPTTMQNALGSSAFFVGSVLVSLGIFALLIALLLPSGEMPTGSIVSVSQAVDAVWQTDSNTGDFGKLNLGDTLHLESGLAQLKYRNGVRVNLEGPSHFVVSGANQGILVRGKISVLAEKVPEGFTVRTPVGKVIDLGTEFGVQVAKNQDTEVQVFQGLVKLEVSEPGTQKNSVTMPVQSLELSKGDAVSVDAKLRTVQTIAYIPDQFARTYQDLKPYFFEDFSEDVSHKFVGKNSLWGGEGGVHAVADGSLIAEVEPCAYSVFSQDKLLGANEAFALDIPAPKPGMEIFVVVSTAIDELQGGPEGGVGFRVRRDLGRGLIVQQTDSSRCFPMILDASQTEDPTPGQPLRLVVQRSNEIEFSFYYELKGERVKIFGPVVHPELIGAERLYIGVEVLNRNNQKQKVIFDNLAIRPASE